MSVTKAQLLCIPLERNPHYQTNMLYDENALTVTGTTGAIGNYFFRMNDAFDPNSTGTGHQPMGFDQMMLMFEQFFVLRAHVRLRAWNSASVTAVLGLQLRPDTTNIPPEQCEEIGLIRSVRLAAKGTFGDYKEINLVCDCPKYFGLTKQSYIANTFSFGGTAAATPAEIVYCDVICYDLSGASTVTVVFEITISYDIFFQEPRQLGESITDLAKTLDDCFLHRKVLRPEPPPKATSLQKLREALERIGMGDDGVDSRPTLVHFSDENEEKGRKSYCGTG